MQSKNKTCELREPPRLADAFLEWYCASEFIEEVQGDLHELYRNRVREIGKARANVWYCVDVLRFFRPHLLKRKLLSPNSGGPIMFGNYLKIAFRNFLRHKGYSFINISGLVIGLTACILILLYIQDELSYDKFHQHADRIYRVTSKEVKDGNIRHLAYNYGPLAPALLTDFPQIEQAVRLFPSSTLVELNEQKRFQEDKFMFADSTFFEIFTFAFKSGNPRTALESPYSIILTEKTAQKYFGDDNPIGQVLTVEGTYDFKVTGVLEDLPSNSHFHFDFLASIGSVRDIQGWALTSWYWPPMYTYILLPPNYPLGRLESQFPDFMAKNIGDWARDQRKLQLQPVTDIRLHSNLEGEIEPTGNIISVYVFSSIAFFILLIACINFMNLATARSANRAKEVGLRKVVGAQRRQLVSQFFGESMFYAVLALILALGLVEFLLPNFNELLDKQLELNLLENWKIIVGFIGLSLLVGFLSGTYPAMFLSGFRPVKVLQEDKFLSKNSSAHVYFRSILVVVQFTISIGLIINASIIQKQLNYIKNKNLGFKKEQIVVVPVHDEIIQQNWSTIKNTLQANPNILGATATSTIPGIERDIDFPIKAEGMSDEFQWNMQTMLVDHDFIETLGMEIIEGRDFAKTFTTDTSDAFILNEAALSKIGWDPSSAIGKKLEMHGVDQGRIKKGKVIGVVKDFHFRSLHHKIEPLLVQISPRPYYLDNLAVKISGHDIAEALTFLEKSWSEIVPHRPFDFTFLDAVFDKIYRKEERLSEMFQYFSALAIFIGCLGLFGLASFTAEQRTKEIGIRKVLGASISNIVFLLSRELVLLIGIAFALASPIAYFSMNRWLQEFVYRIELSFLTFVLSGVAALAIALLTVSYQALKAALSNPVDALRCQ